VILDWNTEAAPANVDTAFTAPAPTADVPAPVPLLRHPRRTAPLALACAAVAFLSHPLGVDAAFAAFMAAVLVVLAATDIERRIIPNRVVLPAAAVMLVGHVIVSPGASIQYLLAGLCAAGVFLIPNLINRSWMGMGDVKLILLLGVGLGSGVVEALAIAFVAQFPVALATVIRGGAAARKTKLPFGPFLALGGLIVLIVPHIVGAG